MTSYAVCRLSRFNIEPLLTGASLQDAHEEYQALVERGACCVLYAVTERGVTMLDLNGMTAQDYHGELCYQNIAYRLLMRQSSGPKQVTGLDVPIPQYGAML